MQIRRSRARSKIEDGADDPSVVPDKSMKLEEPMDCV